MSEPRSHVWLAATGQRWKVWTAYFTSVVQMTSLVVLFVTSEDTLWFAALWTQGLSIVLLAVLIVSVRCRSCGEWVMVWAWRRENGLGALAGLRACPNCGSEGRGAKPSMPSTPAIGPAPPAFSRVREHSRVHWLVYFAVVVLGLGVLRWLATLARS